MDSDRQQDDRAQERADESSGATTRKKSACVGGVKTSKLNGQLRRDWFVAYRQRDELACYCPQSLTTENERQTESSRHRSLDGQGRGGAESESLEMFFATNTLPRKKGERITGDITRFEEGIKFLQDNEIDWL